MQSYSSLALARSSHVRVRLLRKKRKPIERWRASAVSYLTQPLAHHHRVIPPWATANGRAKGESHCRRANSVAHVRPFFGAPAILGFLLCARVYICRASDAYNIDSLLMACARCASSHLRIIGGAKGVASSFFNLRAREDERRRAALMDLSGAITRRERPFFLARSVEKCARAR